MAMQFFRSQFFSYTHPFETDEPVAPVENPATPIDRAYVAAQPFGSTSVNDMFSYDRAPVAGEWADPVPDGASVRVFAINEYTTVRALLSEAGDRIGEPVIDSWRPSATYVPAP